ERGRVPACGEGRRQGGVDALRAQAVAQQPGQLGVVLDDQNAHGAPNNRICAMLPQPAASPAMTSIVCRLALSLTVTAAPLAAQAWPLTVAERTSYASTSNTAEVGAICCSASSCWSPRTTTPTATMRSARRR